MVILPSHTIAEDVATLATRQPPAGVSITHSCAAMWLTPKRKWRSARRKRQGQADNETPKAGVRKEIPMVAGDKEAPRAEVKNGESKANNSKEALMAEDITKLQEGATSRVVENPTVVSTEVLAEVGVKRTSDVAITYGVTSGGERGAAELTNQTPVASDTDMLDATTVGVIDLLVAQVIQTAQVYQGPHGSKTITSEA